MGTKTIKTKPAQDWSRGRLSRVARQFADFANVSEGVARDCLMHGFKQTNPRVAQSISLALPFVGGNKIGNRIYLSMR